MSYRRSFYDRPPVATTIAYTRGVLVLTTPYNAELVQALKTTIPYQDRSFNSDNKAWEVSPIHAATLKVLVKLHLGINVQLPEIVPYVPEIEARTLSLKYIGRCKELNGINAANCMDFGGYWIAVIQESALREYFENLSNHAPVESYYAILNVPQNADEKAIKTAYRRLALQWHPDQCKEQNAADMFRTINDAYNALRDPVMRARYNAGLAYQAQCEKLYGVQDASRARHAALASQTKQSDQWGYRSALRCGNLTCEGVQQGNKFIVSRITDWQDIRRGNSILSTYYEIETKSVIETWQEEF